MPTHVLHTRIDELPRESIDGGVLQRTAVRGDHSLVTINWLAPTDSAPPPHTHPFDQLSFVLEGAMEFTVADEVYLVKAGEVLQIPADAPHTARTLSAWAAEGHAPTL